MSIFVTHGKVKLALHTLREGEGRPLLLLHALGEASPGEVPEFAAKWKGPVLALDFTGHGQSSMPHGGGYTAEILMGDVDCALAMIGEATVAGQGLGAYVALLIAGGRPNLVRGAVLLDGSGLAGGGDRPGPVIVRATTERDHAPDPFAQVELAEDLRPSEYAANFAKLAQRSSGLERPISVVAKARPDWLKRIIEEPGVVESTIEEALDLYASTH
jgi:pimeloyl-ACP methyl ester carboxylesterase